MAVAPNSTVRVLRNVPIDQNYRNTLYFATTDAQYNYFVAQTKYTFSEMTYQRRESSIYVQVSPDALFDCNYIMYQNTNYNTRWFYAFITAVNYVNDNTAEIVFQMDVIQSWWGNWELEQCFVERQHTTTDNIGDNLLAENLALGDYTYTPELQPPLFSRLGLRITVAATFDKNFEPAEGNVVGNTYSGICLNQFSLTDEAGVNEFIQQATEKQLSDGIVGIFIAPYIVGSPISQYGIDYECPKKYGQFGNYTPKNNKLYTYPYNFLYVYTDDGTENDYAYEYFDDSENAVFKIYLGFSMNPDAIMIPQYYKGQSENLSEKIPLGNFQQCAYNIDSFKAWLAQNASGYIINAAQSVVGGAMGAANSLFNSESGLAGAVPGIISNLSNAIFSLAQDVNTVWHASRMPHSAKGSSTGGATTTNGLKNFYPFNARIREEYARNIDSFWTMYGYPIRRVQTPNIHARPQFTYVKTQGCFVRGYMPASDIQRIESIFDNGITFWTNAANVGNYSVNNSPS